MAVRQEYNAQKLIDNSLQKLRHYVEEEGFKGYDPYDVLTSKLNFHIFGKWGPPVATQIMKRFPINIRPIIGISKGYNPKGIGIFLKAYCLLYKKTEDSSCLKQAHWLFSWLIENYTEGYSGMCWGYNFPWASSKEYKNAYLPSVVVTSHVIDGIFSYYMITEDERARQVIQSAADYVTNDIPTTNFKEGISFAYTHQSQGVCYNASLHAAEILARADYVTGKQPSIIIKEAVAYVLTRQKPDGSWYYSLDPDTGNERKQIDFHQGFILVSLQNLMELTGFLRDEISNAIKKGAKFYKEEQFEENGKSMWRLPARWPVDIHNQSQGIITFTMLKDYNPDFLPFAQTIANYTIRDMQSKRGSFYYRKYPLYTNKLSYIRWGQAWMMLALVELLEDV